MADTSDWRPRANPWLIAGAVMAATIMEVLDTSVANVALNHIAGNLSASVDDATWVLTSYLVFKRDRPAGYRLVRTVFWPPQVSHHLHLHFHAGVRLVRLGQQPGHAYPGAYRPGGRRRCASTDLAGGPAGDLSGGKAGFGHVGLHPGCGGSPDPGPDLGRLDDRQLELALGFLH
jgi:hypothetical protein